MADAQAPRRRRVRWVLTLFVVALVAFVATGCDGDEGGQDAEPTFDFVIPAGAGERIDAGEPLDILPAELVAQLDETIQIVNNDDRGHLLGPWFLGPGETLRQRFTTPGVFDGACSVHPTGEFAIIVEE